MRARSRARLAAIQLQGQDIRGQLGQEEIRRVMLDVITRDPSLANERLQLISDDRGGDQYTCFFHNYSPDFAPE